MRPDSLPILLCGMFAGVPGHGGATWAVLHWALGLRALGHDVMIVEPVDAITPDRSRYLAMISDEFGFGGRMMLVAPNGECAGGSMADVVAAADRADVLLNIAGMLTDPELSDRVAERVYVDLDPAFTQLWHEQGIDVGLGNHTAHVTVGLALGSAGCRVPTCGLEWITTPPPVHLDAWRAPERLQRYGLTTVANWRSYGSVEHDGVHHGQKVHAWRELLDIGRRSALPCEPALAIHPGDASDIEALETHGWKIGDPATLTATPDAYREFVHASTAELCIAKSGYVVSRSGWFSDRSAAYLAAGRPVVAQDTGFSRYLPTGTGLLAFDGVDGAVDAIERVAVDPLRHRRAAREIAHDHLRSDRVLTRVLDLALATRSLP